MGFWTRRITENVYVPKHIKQKFEINQYVYMIANDQLAMVKIKEAYVVVREHGYEVSYELYESPYGKGYRLRWFAEYELFKTKDELANSLIKSPITK